jgi:hypothetical protein
MSSFLSPGQSCLPSRIACNWWPATKSLRSWKFSGRTRRVSDSEQSYLDGIARPCWEEARDDSFLQGRFYRGGRSREQGFRNAFTSALHTRGTTVAGVARPETMREIGGAAGVAAVSTVLVSRSGVDGFRVAFVVLAVIAACGALSAAVAFPRRARSIEDEAASDGERLAAVPVSAR